MSMQRTATFTEQPWWHLVDLPRRLPSKAHPILESQEHK